MGAKLSCQIENLDFNSTSYPIQLFTKGGDGYADDPELVETLATAKIAEIEAGYRGEGWSDVRASLERPDGYFNLVPVHAEGKRAPNWPLQ